MRVLVEGVDLAHEELLELAEVREGGGEVVGSEHVLEQLFVDLGVVLLPDPVQLFLHDPIYH